MAERLVARGQCSMCAACRYFHMDRCTYTYEAQTSGCLANETEGGSKAVITVIREVGLSEDHEAVEGRRLAGG